ncbi:MAG: hypothetical protein P8R02_07605 [Pseudomonadales bacterium]|nr:hypothetical protein [Pseudomonadales bacterium]
MKFHLITSNRESSDIKLAICCLVVVLIAWLVIGYIPGLSLMGADALNSLLPMLYQLDSAQGDWHTLAYKFETLGGTNILAVYGVLPLSILLVEIGASPLLSLNISVIVIQWFFCFLAVQSVSAFAGLDAFKWKPKQISRTIACCLLLGFAPFVAYRVDEGHLNIVLGILFIQALIAFWQCHKNRQLSFTTFSMIVFALVHALCSPSFQILVYGLIFSLPILVCFLASKESIPDWRNHLTTTLTMTAVVILACLLAAPVLLEMITFAISEDSTRSVGQNPAIYTYLISTLSDWFTSLFWFYDPVATRPASYLHEIRYGLGPLAVSSLYLLWTGRFAVVLGFAGSIFLCLALSSQLEPLASWILMIFPPLQDFRVPMRSIIPVMVLWSSIVGGYILKDIQRYNMAEDKRSSAQAREQDDTKLKVWIATTLVALTIVYHLSPLGQELVVIGMVIFTVVALARNQPIGRNGLFILSLLSLLAFSEEINFVAGVTPKLESNKQIGELAKQTQPQLAQPLNRIAIDVSRNGLLMSSAGGLQTINGYGFPLRSFSQTVHAMMDRPYRPTTGFFNFGPGQPGFDIIQQLYNICCELQIDGNRVFTHRLKETPGAIWASNNTKRFVNLAEMRAELMRAENLTDSIKQSQYRQSHSVDDGATGTVYAPNILAPRVDDLSTQAKQCGQMSFGNFSHQLEGNLLSVAVMDQTMSCPATVATSFSSQLFVTAIGPDNIVQLETYAAYGGLLGFVIPEGTQSIVIEPRLAGYPLSAILLLLGLFSSMYIAYHSFALRQGPQQTKAER